MFNDESDDDALLADLDDGDVDSTTVGSIPSSPVDSNKIVQNKLPSHDLSSIEAPKEASLLFKKYFGHEKFRPYQWQIIEQAIAGRDQLVVMSTGYGKSTCYQMPPLLQNNLTLVVSPLISLMIDQVEDAKSKGIEAAYINGDVSISDKSEILKKCKNGIIRVLYLTPEYVISDESLLHKLKSQIGLIAIDEAHCVSHWGHEFRSSYRRLSSVRNILCDIPIMALTATATHMVRNDVIENLKLRNADIICGDLNRANLYFSIRSPCNLTQLQNLIIEEDESRGKNFGGATIIYCQTRAVTEEVFSFCESIGVKCAMYHAGMSAKKRLDAHANFSKDRITTIIATVAFGMGINKADVRNIIHYGAPRNIESYYQEIGRAGRDGFPSKCIVFFNDKDLSQARTRILRDDTLREPYKTHTINMQRSMENLLTSKTCRRLSILSHFDSTLQKNISSAVCCDVCDNTEKQYDNEKNVMDLGVESLKLFNALRVFHGTCGIGKVIDFLKGKANVHKIKQKDPLYGSGRSKPELFWKELARMLRLKGYFDEKKSNFSDFACTLSLSDKAEKWIKNGHETLLLEPTKVLCRGKANSALPQSLPSNEFKKTLGHKKLRTLKSCADFDVSKMADINKLSKLLEKQLYEIRTQLAIEMDCGAHIIASNNCIQHMAAIRPSNMNSLELVDDFPKQRRLNYGQRFISVCKQFCKQNSLTMDISPESVFPDEIRNALLTMNDIHREVYESHIRDKLNIAVLSEIRCVSQSTIASYFVNFIKSGLPVHLDVLKIDSKLIATILKTIRENDSDITRLKPIMESLPENFIDYDRLKIIFALLQHEYGTNSDEELDKTQNDSLNNDSDSQKRTIPNWMKFNSSIPQIKKPKSSNLFK